MEEEQFAALRHWGEGLRMDEREEIRAAGKAIVLLCDEVDRLELALWHAKTRSQDQDGVEPGDDAGEDSAFESTLRRRLRLGSRR
jgi:hypothetical protein